MRIIRIDSLKSPASWYPVANGEEFRCAQAIDSLPGLRYWIRNAARDPASFWLPTAAGRFYPDFVAQLDNGRLLVVEYKGALLFQFVRLQFRTEGGVLTS